jgi:FtsH-binding integral membrane protein
VDIIILVLVVIFACGAFGYPSLQTRNETLPPIGGLLYILLVIVVVVLVVRIVLRVTALP